MSGGNEGLPKFTEHEGNRKNERLTSSEGGQPERHILNFLARHQAEASDGGGQRLRILDVGCGRGLRTAWLCEHGWDAYGADVEARYVEQGSDFFEERGFGRDRLRLIEGSALPFDAESFDVVLSDQVVEHVADLDVFVSGIAAVTTIGGVGLHAFPASRRIMEPHMKMPLVHWIPKGSARRGVVRALLTAGVSARHFPDRSLGDRTEIFVRFSEAETFYRSRREVKATFERHGLSADIAGPAHRRMASLAPRAPLLLQRVLGEIDSLLASTFVQTVRIV